MSDSNNQRLHQNTSETSFSISAKDLKSKLDSKRPLMLFDIGERERYEKKHIPGSSYAVCNEESKKKISAGDAICAQLLHLLSIRKMQKISMMLYHLKNCQMLSL